LSIAVAGAIAGIAFTLLLPSASETSIAREEEESGPGVHDSRLSVELVAKGLKFPTSMRFLDESNILVLQKNDGQVRLVSDGVLRKEPVMRADVANEVERGLLGVAIWNGINDTSVFLYITEKDDDAIRNRVYKYSYNWDDRTLAGRTLILDLPGEPGPYHNGGKIAIGDDGYLYVVIGDTALGGGRLDNQVSGREPDDKSVVLRVDRDTGMPAQDNPFYHYGEMKKLKRYYAYGIRNSFGLDFDPVSHSLWITENGPDRYDEINMVRPGFNSGWHKVTGPIARTNMTVDDLVMFDGAKYRDPAFSWYLPVGVTDIEFFNSTKLGEKYENNIFVGDINNGYLYFFEVNGNRTGLQVHDPRLLDLVADPDEGNRELSSIIFGEGFERITDIETGPDGYLYILTYDDGKIYRIVES
jgi:glucose/arabinose dehydrogenase